MPFNQARSRATATTTSVITDRRASLWRHAFVYFWLFFATWSALLEDPGSAGRSAVSLALVGSLGAWYWHWHVAPSGLSAATTSAGRRALAVRPNRVYLLGGALLWVPLVVLDPAFVVAGIAVLGPYCMDSVRFALVLLVPCTAVWLWQSAAAAGGLDWAQAAAALFVVASGVAVTGYVGALTAQNTERQELIDELRAAQADLAAAERRTGMLAERQRLARDIHDTLTQGFASIVLLLEATEATLDADHLARHHVARALRSARDNLADSRRVIWALHPDALACARLPDALRDLVTRLEDETAVRSELVITGTPRDLGPETETALLRLTQEALANVRKHASATRVTVTVSYMDDVTVLDVQDDGGGFEPVPAAGRDRPVASGLGLRVMRERAEALGGRLAVETGLGEGTTIVAEVPVRPTEPASTPGAGR